MAPFLDQETKQQLRWEYVWSLFQPFSKLGQHYQSQVQPFTPADQKRWQADRHDLMFWQTATQQLTFRNRLIQALTGLQSIELLFQKAENQATLQPIDLFKWKQWVWHGKVLYDTLQDGIEGFPGCCTWWPEVDWNGLLRMFQPSANWTSEFSIEDGFDPNLLVVREQKRKLQRQMDQLRQQQTNRLREKYGGIPNARREFIWSRDDTERIQLAAQDTELRLAGETTWEIVFQVQDEPTAQILTKQIEPLMEQEAQWEQQVLQRLSRQLAEFVPLFRQCEIAWGRLDWILTRLVLLETNHTAPEQPLRWSLPVWTDRWEAKGAWHPLLAESLAKKNRILTAVSYVLKKGVSILTGPNMGGKTVALRTAGLLQALAQYGMPVPAGSFSFIPVDQIRFVGGDLQSMEDGLSTFGGEMVRLSKVLRQLDKRCLLLLDEIGRGTNPQEGEALAIGVTRFLQKLDWITWFATHYPGVAQLEGTYQWQVVGLSDYQIVRAEMIDKQGESLQIAAQLGLPPEILQLANRRRGSMGKLDLDPTLITRARQAALTIAQDAVRQVERHTTVAVERTVLRLFGLDSVDADGVPLPNVIVDQIHRQKKLAGGAAYPVVNAMLQTGWTIQQVAEAVAAGDLHLFQVGQAEPEQIKALAMQLAEQALARIRKNREVRNEYLNAYGDRPQPYIYVIVATGNIYEDVVQARAAARQGADIIAVIRSTGQSLLDYVPYGPTTEGFGGTFATQANFSIMRQALDEVGKELGRYVRLCNYASGLCMPEIAAMGALERLDVMLNDALYGILFRDINMQRTLIDQHFSRMINAYAGVIINTGEDNYLTTADAVEAAHTVLASQFINEQLALLAGLPEAQMGLGHAFEMNPAIADGFLLELAQAQMAREIFPQAPLKYMPPTKHMTGNIFRGHVQDALFNLVGIMTGQGIQLLGMMTEAIHTPLIHERQLAIEAAAYIFNNARHLAEEIEFKRDGIIAKRAQEVLQQATELLEEIQRTGIFAALEKGIFADVKRSFTGGKGLEGVIERSDHYFNPLEQLLKQELRLTGEMRVAYEA